MSVVAELGLRPVRPSVLGAPVRFVGSTALGARLVSRVIPGIDRAVLRLSGGRITAVDRLSGLPAIELTTTGARSGAARTVLLIAVVVGDELAVVGSNWGRSAHPGWVHNLAADPRASAAHAGRRVDVRAREVTGEHAERIWRTARSLYRGYRTYPGRTGGRVIRVFVLEAAGAPGRA